MKHTKTPEIFELIQYGEWLQEHFNLMGYTLKEVFNIDFDKSHLAFIRRAYETTDVGNKWFEEAIKKLQEIVEKYKSGDYKLPKKEDWFSKDENFYNYIKKYWNDYGELPLEKIKSFYDHRRPDISKYALKEFQDFIKEIKPEEEIEYPTLEEIQKLKDERAVSHRSAGKGKTQKMSVCDRPAITEHTFSLEEFFKRNNDKTIYPYLEPHEYYAIVKPLLKLTTKIVVVKAIINHQLINVILLDQDMADEDFAHYVTYMRKKIPTEYWDTLYIKKINEYDLFSFRENLRDLELIYEAADKQYKNPDNWYGIVNGFFLKPIKLFSLWMRTKDGVNGMLMITPNSFEDDTKDVKRIWKRVELENLVEQTKIERKFEIYHDFELLPFVNVIRDTPETETLYILEMPIKECLIIPDVKNEIERQHAKIIPWHGLPEKTSITIQIINKDKNEDSTNRIDFHTMSVIGKYFESFKDFENIEKCCKEYRGLIDVYHYNPVPLRKKQMKLFIGLEKYLHYTKDKPDFYLHILKQNDEQWQWNQDHLNKIARGATFPHIVNGDSLVQQFEIKDDIILPDEPTEELLSGDRLDLLIEKWKTYEPNSEDE